MSEQTVAEAAPTSAHGTKYTRNNPYTARVLVNEVLTGVGSEKETRHIELDLEDGMTYIPGMRWGFCRRTGASRWMRCSRR